jgi:aspartate-semialdehyde dehydrogenase
MAPRIDVGVLGATGMVGQQFVRLLDGHPWLNLTWLAASERSEGRAYAEAAAWRLAWPLPDAVGRMTVDACTPGRGPRLVFSALDAGPAAELEAAFARAGHVVISNARSWRMDSLVPLLVPEINADHLALLPRQQEQHGWPGAIVTNPNCSTVALTMALAPLRAFGLSSVLVTTMQAVSGAGYPGVPSLDILGNVIPGIPGEEEKIERETQKILGSVDAPHPVVVSAHTNRVPVIDGHTVTVSIRFEREVTVDEVIGAFGAFRGRPQDLGLPSAPPVPVLHLDGAQRPQPRLDAERDRGMTVTVGRVRRCPVLGIKLVALGHNTVRGAAGAAILNAELMAAEGSFDGVKGKGQG